jgi:peptidyl-prolyl cis-trans isomerase B (cyclophilin B)
VSRHLAVLTATLALLVAGCGSDNKSDDESAATATSSPAATATASAAATSAPDLSNGCAKASKPAAKDVGKIKKPTEKLDPSKTYTAVVKTNCGDFSIKLDAKRAPITGGNFKYLADMKFFDNTTFHRIVPDFVIQGGDPAGTGEGGPGYTVVEAPPKTLKYTPGIVAMAKTGSDPAGASGSQFFVVTGASASQLTPDYALLGKVTAGMDVVKKIGAIQADPNSGQPAVTVLIKSIAVSEK